MVAAVVVVVAVDVDVAVDVVVVDVVNLTDMSASSLIRLLLFRRRLEDCEESKKVQSASEVLLVVAVVESS